VDLLVIATDASWSWQTPLAPIIHHAA